MKQILTYKTSDGKCPFENWLKSLDNGLKVRVSKRIERVEEGNFGDCKKLDEHISELRLKFGSGYRIYYTEIDDTIVILLSGGDKSSQKKDITTAKTYYKDLIERNS